MRGFQAQSGSFSGRVSRRRARCWRPARRRHRSASGGAGCPRSCSPGTARSVRCWRTRTPRNGSAASRPRDAARRRPARRPPANRATTGPCRAPGRTRLNKGRLCDAPFRPGEPAPGPGCRAGAEGSRTLRGCQRGHGAHELHNTPDASGPVTRAARTGHAGGRSSDAQGEERCQGAAYPWTVGVMGVVCSTGSTKAHGDNLWWGRTGSPVQLTKRPAEDDATRSTLFLESKSRTTARSAVFSRNWLIRKQRHFRGSQGFE